MAKRSGPTSGGAHTHSGHFATTRWSIVVAAGQEPTVPARAALATLCEMYWPPVYAFIRHQGIKPDLAEDLTQGFFARVLEKKDLADVDPSRGRFRSWLLASVKHYLANEWDRSRAQKRGGNRRVQSFNAQAAEDSYLREPSHGLTAERLFDRHWAMGVLERVMGQLREEASAQGKERSFKALSPFLAGKGANASLAAVAADLGMTEGAACVAVTRLRQRCRQLVIDTIAQTVAQPEDIDEELKHLFSVLGRSGPGPVRF